MRRIWGSEAAKTITNGIVVLIVVMKKMSSNEMDTELVSVTWDYFSNDFWSVSRSARAGPSGLMGLMATWPERSTELHQSSRPNSSPLRSARPHDLGSAEVCRNVANINFSTEPLRPLRKCCLRHPWWWLVIISLFDQRWCPLISHEMPMKTLKTQFYASRLCHEPHKHCLRNWNSYQLPTTISHLLVSNKIP